MAKKNDTNGAYQNDTIDINYNNAQKVKDGEGTWNNGTFTIKQDIHSVEDLRGKIFAIPHKQSTHNLLLQQLLKEHGMSPRI